MRRVLFLLFLCPFVSQAVEVKVFVDKSSAALNESLTLTISVKSEGEELKGLDIPHLSQLDDFHVLGQWSGKESSFSSVNGRWSKTFTVSKNYKLQPKTTGTLRISPLTIRAGGKVWTTDPIFIQARQGGKTPPSPQPAPPFPLPPFFKSPFEGFSAPFFNESPADVKLILDISKSSLYKGEMARADWSLLLSSGAVNYEISKFPALKGFWKEDIKPKARPPAGTKLIGKVLYKKIWLNSLWVFPLQNGELEIDSLSVRVQPNFGFFSQPKAVSSPIRKIRARELSAKGWDSSWTGAVGQWNIRAEIKESSAIAFQPLSYKIIFEGRGHPRFIRLPELKFPSAAQTYPPAEKSQFFDSGKGIKEFEILIVPQKPGLLKIPSFRLSVFDPEQEKYIAHQTPAFSFFVQKGERAGEEGQTFFEEDKERKTTDFLKPLDGFYWPRLIRAKSLARLWLILFFASLAGFIFLLIKSFRPKKEKKLKDRIQGELAEAQKLLDKKEWRKACGRLIQLSELLLESAQISASSSGWRSALSFLPPSLSEKYGSSYEALFKNLESLSFSPKAFPEPEAVAQAKALFKRAQSLADSFLSDSQIP